MSAKILQIRARFERLREAPPSQERFVEEAFEIAREAGVSGYYLRPLIRPIIIAIAANEDLIKRIMHLAKAMHEDRHTH